MTQVDFYILGAQHLEAQQHFACRLTEKAARNGHKVLLHTHDQTQAAALDLLLWSFRPDSFTPHATVSLEPNSKTIDGLHEHVAISCDATVQRVLDDINHHDVLINLASTLPPFYSRFERLVEIVVQHDDVLSATRAHYKHLNERGYPIKNTDMRIQ